MAGNRLLLSGLLRALSLGITGLVKKEQLRFVLCTQNYLVFSYHVDVEEVLHYTPPF